MIPRHLKLAAGILAAATLTLGNAIAEPYKQGSKVEPFTAKDQHGKVTVLKLSKGTVASVNYWSPGERNPDDVLK